MRLNICSGPVWLSGYVNTDIDTLSLLHGRCIKAGLIMPQAGPNTTYLQADLLLPWPWADGTATEILADNCLEHFDHAGLNHLFAEALRVLAPGATMTGRVPDIERIVAYAAAKADWSWEPQWALGGPYQTTAYNALQNMAHGWGHKQVFTGPMLQERLRLAGFAAAVEPCETQGLRFTATKPTEG